VCEGNTAKSGTAATADEAVDPEAVMKHTRNQRGTYEGNATISMKAMQQYQ